MLHAYASSFAKCNTKTKSAKSRSSLEGPILSVVTHAPYAREGQRGRGGRGALVDDAQYVSVRILGLAGHWLVFWTVIFCFLPGGSRRHIMGIPVVEPFFLGSETPGNGLDTLLHTYFCIRMIPLAVGFWLPCLVARIST